MEPHARAEIPLVPRAARIAAVAVGVVVLAVGAVAVFVTDNELGSTALVAAGVAIAGLATFANRIRSVQAGGVRVELERQAHGVRQLARRARAAGDVEQAEQLEDRAQSLMAAASLVGSRYERLRADEPAGWDRTSRMEGILREARALDTEGLSAADVQRIFETGTEGNRIAALALIEATPGLATADVLVDAISGPRSTFEQYHALRATQAASEVLSSPELSRVADAIEAVLAGPLGERTSDRRTLARRLLEDLGSAGPSEGA